ncbi:MAG TPA: hypothetical protein VLU43_09850 [Anaeromyxobacteraceae bacterium]|nr:hypothetical protein [Anaeromyxobacteraceae bacterium]
MRPGADHSVFRTGLAALALAGAACSDTLLDHNADPALLNNCAASQVACGALCFAEDGQHCGGSCADCSASAQPPANAGPACVAHACTFECDPGWLRSGNACVRARAVSAGWAHTCALLDDGSVKCWGANEHGQLGDGGTLDSSVPVPVALPDTASAVAAGYVHTCAVVGTAGAVWCWGDNTTGSLGDGSTIGRTSPVQVSGLTGATAIAAGGGEVAETPPAPSTYYGHTCALVPTGVKCWGSNESGQLGNDSFVESHVPVQTSGITTTPAGLSVGDRHTCAVVSSQALCWGADGSKQLGDGSNTNQARPQTAINSGVTAVAAGAAHSCAVVSGASSGELWCWGSNSNGQANGVASFGDFVNTPQLVPPLTAVSFTSAAGGNEHTCAVESSTGGVVCFGANLSSQLSGGRTARGKVTTPLTGIAAVTAGYEHTCALRTDGGVQCWGDNERGQIGAGASASSVQVPTYVSGR